MQETLTMDCQENETKQSHGFNPDLEEPQDQHEVRDANAGHGEGHTDVQDGRIRLHCNGLVVFGLDVPFLRESWDLEKYREGYDGARDNWNPPIIGDKVV